MNPLLAYFIGAYEELRKVTWPTKEQAALLTGIVVGVSITFAILIGFFDFGVSEGYEYLLQNITK